MFATPLRTLPRSLPVRALPQVRYATSSSRYNAYKSQKTKPVVFASLGLVALFGWTAAILTVGAKGGKKDKAARGAKKAHAETTPSPEAAASSSDDASTSSTTPAEGDNAGAGQSAAFNPETGEINWDCPCLGGMADGPCGEDFKQAFSCFIFSEAEPKGIDCVEKFRGMQECFRKYPEIYGSDAEDLEADEEDEGFDLVSRAEAALALPDEHFMEEVAREAPAHKEA